MLRLTELTHTEISQPQDTHTLTHIRPTHIINTEKDKYITHWTNTIKNQHKLECYSALNREYTAASYLSTVSDVRLRKTLTMYRLSEHSLAVETGRRRQTWLSREDRLCSQCMLGVMETELHFLTECTKYKDIRDHYYPKINKIFPQFNTCNPTQKLSFILGEEAKCCNIAARFVSSCDLLRDSQRETHTHTHTHTHTRIILWSPERQPERNTHTHTHSHTHSYHLVISWETARETHTHTHTHTSHLHTSI